MDVFLKHGVVASCIVIARGAVGGGSPQGEKNFGLNLGGVSCKWTTEGKDALLAEGKN